MKEEESSLPPGTFEISLKLEQYNDIFSDFDIRSLNKRALSVDFLDEIKRATSEMKDENIEMVLHMPEKDRKEYEEGIIKERLATHFKRHFHLLQAEKKKILKTGVGMVILGIFSMIIAAVLYSRDDGSFFSSFLIIFFEPAAWFLWWEGLDQIIFNSKNINPNLYFYRKMMNAHKNIHFKSY
ncbi:hypothetical protein HYZ82_02860 [Candidatus Nomurabacteria bacterium]|nr:hypothetical protein [Candidatus Nomurabacteria bacterium]